MTDYLEEVLEEETEDREEFRVRRTVVRRGRREMQELPGEEGEDLPGVGSAVSDIALRGADIVTQDRRKEENILFPSFSMRRRASVLWENGDPSEKMREETGLNPEDPAEREEEQESEKATEEEDAETVRELMPGRRSAVFRAEETARRGETGAVVR